MYIKNRGAQALRALDPSHIVTRQAGYWRPQPPFPTPTGRHVGGRHVGRTPCRPYVTGRHVGLEG